MSSTHSSTISESSMGLTSRQGGPSSSTRSQRRRSGGSRSMYKQDTAQMAFHEAWKQKYWDERPPTQKLVEEGEALCICPTFHSCEKVATIHPDRNCSYCYGATSRVFPKGNIHRYYPCDNGWEELRALVVKLREYAPSDAQEQESPSQEIVE